MTSIYRVNYQLRPHKRDEFIEFIKSLILPTFILRESHSLSKRDTYAEIFGAYVGNNMSRVENLVADHRKHQDQGVGGISRLMELVSSIGSFYTDLPLRQAFLEYDDMTRVSAREHVPPSFNDIRHILTIAQTHAIAPQLKLITFDGDQTLYPDGDNFRAGKLGTLLVKLIAAGLNIAIVTAAGYAHQPKKYEERLSGLLDMMKQANFGPDAMGRFYVLGGECNYLFRCTPNGELEEVPAEEYLLPEQHQWSEADISSLIDTAERSLRNSIEQMNLPAVIMRKERAIGMVRSDPKAQITRENLDEAALRVKLDIHQSDSTIPFCAFNGGSDVWVDVGNKLLGVQVMQKWLGAGPGQTLHVGDQFLGTGNDISTRTGCSTIWIASPKETEAFLRILIDHLRRNSAVAALLHNINPSADDTESAQF